MNILYITYALDGLLTIAAPIVLAVVFTKKFDLYWRLFWIGAVVFALSEIAMGVFSNYVVYPFIGRINNDATLTSITVLIFSALLLGLCAALFGELLRYGMFRWWAKEARSWVDGVLTGIGYGGAAAIFIGALIIYNFVNMAMVKNTDLSTLLTPEQVPQAQAQISAFWSAPWYSTLNDFVQQLFTLIVQIALTLVILQVFIRKQWYWLVIALFAHTIFEASRLIAQNLLNPYLMDLVIIGFGLAGIAVIIALRPSDPTKQLTTEPAKA